MHKIKADKVVPCNATMPYPVDVNKINWNAVFTHNMLYLLNKVDDSDLAVLLDTALPENAPYYIGWISPAYQYYTQRCTVCVLLYDRKTKTSIAAVSTEPVDLEKGLLEGHDLDILRNNANLRDPDYLCNIIDLLRLNFIEGKFDEIYYELCLYLYVPDYAWQWRSMSDLPHHTGGGLPVTRRHGLDPTDRDSLFEMLGENVAPITPKSKILSKLRLTV